MPPKRKTPKRKSPSDSRPSTALLDGVYGEKAFQEVEKLRKRYQERIDNIIEEGNKLLRIMLRKYAERSTATMDLLRSANGLTRRDIARVFDIHFSVDGIKIPFPADSTVAVVRARILNPTHYTLAKYKLILEADVFTPEELKQRFPFLLILKMHWPGDLHVPVLVVATRSRRRKAIAIDRTHRRRAFHADTTTEGLYVQILEDRSKLPPVFSHMDHALPMYKTGDRASYTLFNHIRWEILQMPRFVIPAAALSHQYADVPMGLVATARLVFWCCRLLRKSVLSHDLVPCIMQFLLGPCVTAALESILTPQEFLWCVAKPLPTM